MPFFFFLIDIKSTWSWNRHVFKDIKPYICTFTDCSIPDRLYESRREWLFHETTEHHRESLACTLCEHTPESSKLYERHVARHLEELALFALPKVELDDDDDDQDDHESYYTQGFVVPGFPTGSPVSSRSRSPLDEDEHEDEHNARYQESENRASVRNKSSLGEDGKDDNDFLGGSHTSVRFSEHSNTLSSMINLASTYRSQGRWTEAEELELQVLEKEKRILGAEHPETLSSMHSLAYLYRSQGRYREAEELKVQLLKLGKGVWGAAFDNGPLMGEDETEPRIIQERKTSRTKSLRGSSRIRGDRNSSSKSYNSRSSDEEEDRLYEEAGTDKRSARDKIERLVLPTGPEFREPSSNRSNVEYVKDHLKSSSSSSSVNENDRLERDTFIATPSNEDRYASPAPKTILRESRKAFPENPKTYREDVGPRPKLPRKGIPANARWTKVNRNLVNPQSLEEEGIKFNEYVDHVIVLKAMDREEIEKYVTRTAEIRAERRQLRLPESPIFDNSNPQRKILGPNKSTREDLAIQLEQGTTKANVREKAGE